MNQNSQNNINREQPYCNNGSALYATIPTTFYRRVDYPSPNNGSSSDHHHNNVVHSNATNAIQPGRPVHFDNYSSNVTLNPSMPQYNENPLQSFLPTNLLNNNDNNDNGPSSAIYSDTTFYSNIANAIRMGQSVPCDNGNNFSNLPILHTTALSPSVAITENPPQSASSLPTNFPNMAFNLSQIRTNDSGIHRFMIPGFEIIVVPVSSPGNVNNLRS